MSDFHENRKKGIGASDVSAILGVNPYKTPVDVWLEKTGRSKPGEGNVYTEAGTKIEPVVADYFQDRSGHRVIKASAKEFQVVHPVHDYLRHHPDREYFDKNGGRKTLECKTKYFQKPVKGDLPLDWYIQNQYQVGISGQSGGSIAWIAFSFGVEFDYEEFDLDKAFYDRLINEAGGFWVDYVLTDTPPPAVNAKDTESLFPSHVLGKSIEASQETYDLYLQLVSAKQKVINAKADLEGYENEFKMIFGDASAITYNQKEIATWKRSKDSLVVDSKKLQENFPDIYSQVLKVRKGSRRFLIK